MANLITLTTDFGKQTQGVGNLEGVIFSINPNARVIHLMHGLPAFDILSAARTMETLYFMPVGFHVCVVDPGVGTNRRALVIKVTRGDYLIGPDNGCLMTALQLLGGIEKVVEFTNEKYMLTPISPTFHGRHVFAPAAAHLSNGVALEDLGKELSASDLAPAPYQEAQVRGNKIEATVIHANHFGSVHLNILHNEWDKLGIDLGEKVILSFGEETISLPFVETFGNVKKDECLIMKDDYNRVEVAVNTGSFVEKHALKVGDKVIVEKC